MRFFRPAVERALKAAAAIALITAILVPVGWGYEQRRQARTWRQTACAYRLRELSRGTTFLAKIDRGDDPCATLRDFGLDLESEP